MAMTDDDGRRAIAREVGAVYGELAQEFAPMSPDHSDCLWPDCPHRGALYGSTYVQPPLTPPAPARPVELAIAGYLHGLVREGPRMPLAGEVEPVTDDAGDFLPVLRVVTKDGRAYRITVTAEPPP